MPEFLNLNEVEPVEIITHGVVISNEQYAEFIQQKRIKFYQELAKYIETGKLAWYPSAGKDHIPSLGLREKVIYGSHRDMLFLHYLKHIDIKKYQKGPHRVIPHHVWPVL